MDITGTKIYSDSLASAVRDDYRKLLGFGASDEEAEQIMLKAYEGYIGTVYESIFWISFGYTQWKLGRLSKKIRDKVVAVIESGDDLKKWEKVILIEPKLRADGRGLQLKSLIGLLEKDRLGDQSQSNIERGLQNYYDQNIQDLVAFAQSMPAYNSINTEELIDLSDDPFSQSINFINGSAIKKYESRKQELLTFKSNIDLVNPRKKVQKPYYDESPWKLGDCIAFRLDNMKDDYQRLNGKWAAFRVVRIIEKPVIDFLPALGHDDTIIISFYDYIGEKCPTQSDILNADYMIISRMKSLGNRTELHKGIWLSLYAKKRFLKKWEWKLIDNNPDFEKHDPEFFNEGAFGAFICGLDNISQYFMYALEEKAKSVEITKS